MNYKKSFSAISTWCAKVCVCGIMIFGAFGASAQVVVGGNVFGGGNAANVTGNATVQMEQVDATVEHDVYGGGALANVGGNTVLHILEGNVNGSVYGGGLGQKGGVAAMVNGTATVNIGSSEQTSLLADGISYNTVVIGGNVFGANNLNGTPQGNITVNIYHTKHTAANVVPVFANDEQLVAAPHGAANFALQGVYGGGNEAHYLPNAVGRSTTVTIYGCENTVKMVYGGGRAADVGATPSINANANVIVWGGRIDTLFAGGDGHTTDALGAYREANIYGNASGAIHGGYYGAAFAGSNTSGTISGTMGLSLDKSGPCATTQEEIIGSLSRIVKKQVGERTDSTTSDAINKMVDGVTDMIRNEVTR